MSHEALEAKAARLLTSGCLTLHEVGPAVIRATCIGDSGKRYHLGWAPRGGFGCSCPAWQFTHACAHTTALRKVVNEPTREDAAGPGPLTAVRLRQLQDEATRVRAGRRSA